MMRNPTPPSLCVWASVIKGGPLEEEDGQLLGSTKLTHLFGGFREVSLENRKVLGDVCKRAASTGNFLQFPGRFAVMGP